jgi:hypothetical protein
LSPLGGQNVKQKARYGRLGDPARLNPYPGRPTKMHSIKESAMRFCPSAAILAVIVLLGGGPAVAAVCLDKSMTLDEIVDVIAASPGCERAMKVFKECEFGTSGDVRLGAAVEKKCEGDFLGRLKAPQKQVYKREMGVCDRKYRNESGTMYLSFTAFCRAEVARRFSQRAQKDTGPLKPR